MVTNKVKPIIVNTVNNIKLQMNVDRYITKFFKIFLLIMLLLIISSYIYIYKAKLKKLKIFSFLSKNKSNILKKDFFSNN